MKKILCLIVVIAIALSIMNVGCSEINPNALARKAADLFYTNGKIDHYFFCYFSEIDNAYYREGYPVESAFGIKKAQIPQKGLLFTVKMTNGDLIEVIMTSEYDIVAAVSLSEHNAQYKDFSDLYKAVRPYWENNTISVDMDIRVAYGDQMRALQNKGSTISYIYLYAMGEAEECEKSIYYNQWYYY